MTPKQLSEFVDLTTRVLQQVQGRLGKLEAQRAEQRLAKAEASIKTLEQFSVMNFVGTAEPGVPYARGTLALDSTGRMWFATKDDDDGKGDLCEPTWRLMSDRRLSVISTEAR